MGNPSGDVETTIVERGSTKQGDGKRKDSFSFEDDVSPGEGSDPGTTDSGGGDDGGEVRERVPREPRSWDRGEPVGDGHVQITYVTSSETSSGSLTVTTADESYTVSAHSGFPPAGKARIPPGEYAILRSKTSLAPLKYRLEALDQHFGNDEVDIPLASKTSFLDPRHLRLHIPGTSKGCISPGSFHNDLSREAFASWRRLSRTLESATRRPTYTEEMLAGWTFSGLFGYEELDEIGRLRVTSAK